ncbi:hypothetical protein ACFV24_23250 [Nocardia fluminea]|uniref:hypothetical protein n=1 Tax=Nocardia fluminea TaxID=134984 RepID=UPI00366C8C7D
MTHQTTLPTDAESPLRDILRTPAVRQIRRRATHLATHLATALAGRLRLAVVAGLALVTAAATALLGAVFAMAALVRGLEQVVPTWVAYAITACLLLLSAAVAIALGTWALLRAGR